MSELIDVVNAIEDTNSSLSEINDNLVLVQQDIVLIKDNEILYQEGIGLFIVGLNERLDALELKFDDNEALYTREEMKEVSYKYYEQLEDIKAMNTYNFVFFGVILAALIVVIISGLFRRV